MFLRRFIPILFTVCIALTVTASGAKAVPKLQHITFGLDWRAEAEYGGFYEAVANGIYRKYGLDVTIRQGGPEVNNAQLLVSDKLDFDITSNGFLAFNFVQQKMPFVAIAAIFQKDPDILMTHHGIGEDSFASLKGKPIAISVDSRASWWLFLKQKYGYRDSQLRPYDFSVVPFFVHKDMAMEGYATSEPYLIKQKTGHGPVVLSLADAGFDGYAQLIAASNKLIKSDPSLVRRFIAASIEGWKEYLNGDPKPAFALIRKANPDMSEGLLHFGYDTMKRDGLVTSGAAQTLGIGAMTADRWHRFFEEMHKAGLYPADFNWRAAFTLQFVDHSAPPAKP